MQLTSSVFHAYAVGVADIAACEGSPHNVLHSSSQYITCFSKNRLVPLYLHTYPYMYIWYYV